MLKVSRLVVADDAAAADPLVRTAMGLALPPSVALEVAAVDAVDFPALAASADRTLVLFRDVASLLRARARGLVQGPVNLGNVHAGQGRTALSRTVYLTAEERERLQALSAEGVEVSARAVPTDPPQRVG